MTWVCCLTLVDMSLSMTVSGLSLRGHKERCLLAVREARRALVLLTREAASLAQCSPQYAGSIRKPSRCHFVPSKPSAPVGSGPTESAARGAAAGGLDLSLGHIRTTKGEKRSVRVLWVVWVLDGDGAWKCGPTLPEGAAFAYVSHKRMIKAFSLEAVSELT